MLTFNSYTLFKTNFIEIIKISIVDVCNLIEDCCLLNTQLNYNYFLPFKDKNYCNFNIYIYIYIYILTTTTTLSVQDYESLGKNKYSERLFIRQTICIYMYVYNVFNFFRCQLGRVIAKGTNFYFQLFVRVIQDHRIDIRG